MSQELVVHLIKETLWISFLIAGPILIVGLVVGLVIGILQSVTQVHEMTLTFIPKIVAVALTLLFLMPWMMQSLLAYTTNLFSLITGLS